MTPLPPPCSITLDPRFDSFVMFNAPLKRLATGFNRVEGPVWFGDAGCLLFSDIPNDRIMRYRPGLADPLSICRAPSNHSNGQTRDRQGRLLTCEHGLRRVTRTEHDGAITVIGHPNRQRRQPLVFRRRRGALCGTGRDAARQDPCPRNHLEPVFRRTRQA